MLIFTFNQVVNYKMLSNLLDFILSPATKSAVEHTLQNRRKGDLQRALTSSMLPFP